MICQVCNKRMGFREYCKLRVHPTGGRYPLEDSYDSWIACHGCGAKIDEFQEWVNDRNRKALAAHELNNAPDRRKQ